MSKAEAAFVKAVYASFAGWFPGFRAQVYKLQVAGDKLLRKFLEGIGFKFASPKKQQMADVVFRGSFPRI
jgi:hypothetical protein